MTAQTKDRTRQGSLTLEKKTNGSGVKEKTIQIKTTESIKYLIDLAVTESRVSITDFLLFGIVPALQSFVTLKLKKESSTSFTDLPRIDYQTLQDWEEVENALLTFRGQRKLLFDELEKTVTKKFDPTLV
jgi:uncharacterized protein (DUF1778 family)